MSHARAHFQRVVAAAASAAAEPGQPLENCSQYDLMLLKLAEDRRRLKLVQSTVQKAEVKRQLLPDYAAWVDGVLSAGKGHQDDVLTTIMVWRIDAGDYAGALDIAAYAIPHKLTLPDQYQRPLATAIAEEVADAAKRARDGEQPFDLEILQRTAELTSGEDMFDQVRAKLHKELGLLLEGFDKPAALTHLQRAMQLHDKVGVKKDIERILRDMKNSGADSA